MNAPSNSGLRARSSHDTSAEAARLQIEAWKRMGGSERLRIALELSDAIRAIARDGAARRDSGPRNAPGAAASREP